MKERIPRRDRARNNFITAVGYIVIMMVAVLSALTLFFYSSFSNYAEEQMAASSLAITDNVCDSITKMNTSIRSLCATLFTSSDVQYLMQVDDPESIKTQQAISHLKNMASANQNIQAIITYNRRNGAVYSTIRGISDIDADIKAILQTESIRQLTPMPRLLNETDYYSDSPVFSYVMYDGYEPESIGSALIVNIKASWLSQLLKQLCGQEETLIIFDDEMHQLASSSAVTKNFDTLVPNYCLPMRSGQSDIIDTAQGEKLFVSVSPISGTNWYLMRQVPYTVLRDQVHALEQSLLIVTFLIMFAAVAISFLVVYFIYRPIRKIALTIQNFSNTPVAVRRDDLSYISQAVTMIEQKYRHLQESTSEIVRENLLRSLLLGVNRGSSSSDLIDDVALFQEVFQNGLLLVIRLDNLSSFLKLPTDQQLLNLAKISAILSEFLPIYEESCLTDTASGDFAAIIRTSSKVQMEQFVRQAQHAVQESCGISISIFAEDPDQPKTDYVAIDYRYRQLLKLSKYRIFSGIGCFITDQDWSSREQKPLSYPESTASALYTALKRNSEEESLLLYARFREEAMQNNVENYKYCMMQMLSSFQSLLDERSSYSAAAMQIDISDLSARYFRAEYSQQIDDIFQTFIVRFCTMDGRTANRHSILLESIREYINLHYADSDLSLKQIASDFHISQAYLGKLFREEYKMSLKDYMTQVRLEAAAQQLSQTTQSIRQIMSNTGFDNESNFYRLFRSCYGITPNNYRLSYSIKRLQQ